MRKLLLFVVLISFLVFNCDCIKRKGYVESKIQAGPETIYVDDTFSADFEIFLVGEMTGIGFNVIYDSSKIEYIENVSYNIFDHEVIALENGLKGKLITGFNNISSPSLVDTTAIILAVSFRALEVGTTQIIFENGSAINNDDAIDAYFNDAEMEVMSRSRVTVNVNIRKNE